MVEFRFRDLVAKLLERHPAHTDAASLAYFQHAFSETDKLSFRGEEDDRELLFILPNLIETGVNGGL